MVTLEPFRGLRYAADILEPLIAPPYDVVSANERARLAARSPCNAVRLELPEPDPVSGADRYAAAAALLRSWLASGVLAVDPRPALYPYRTVTPDGRTSTGVIGALGIGDDVLPHEQTLPKPRSDRLELQRATASNLSPIWALSLTPGLTTRFAPEGAPAMDVVDDDRVRHQLWLLTDPARQADVAEAVAASPLVIADGHHRYETAVAYRDEVRAANGDRPGPHDAVMALVVELSEEELSVGAIHRLVRGLGRRVDVPAAFGRWFEVEAAGPVTGESVASLVAQRQLAVLTAEGAWRLTRRSMAGDELDAAVVDRSLDALPAAARDYEGSPSAVLDALRTGAADLAVLLRPVTVALIAEWAAAGRRMPPKTTYFTPKPRSGLVYRLLAEG